MIFFAPSTVNVTKCLKNDPILHFCTKRYPDGKCYLKLGHGDPYDERVSGKVGLQEWYRRREGNPEAVEELSSFIREYILNLNNTRLY